jgi:exodeoxyribonuclease-1
MEVERQLTDRLVDETAGGLTLGQVLQAIEIEPVEGRADVEGLLAHYRVHLSDRISRVSEFRSSNLRIS